MEKAQRPSHTHIHLLQVSGQAGKERVCASQLDTGKTNRFSIVVLRPHVKSGSLALGKRGVVCSNSELCLQVHPTPPARDVQHLQTAADPADPPQVDAQENLFPPDRSFISSFQAVKSSQARRGCPRKHCCDQYLLATSRLFTTCASRSRSLQAKSVFQTRPVLIKQGRKKASVPRWRPFEEAISTQPRVRGIGDIIDVESDDDAEE